MKITYFFIFMQEFLILMSNNNIRRDNMIEEKNIPILCTDIIFKSIFIDMESIIIKFIYDITGYKLDNIILTINEIPITRKNEKFKRSRITKGRNSPI